MAVLNARKARLFFGDILDPLQKHLRRLYDGDRQADALYLAANLVTFAIRQGILRDVVSFVDRQQTSGSSNPIGFAAEVARGVAGLGRIDLTALPAATSLVGLGRYLGIDDAHYEDIYDPDRFVALSERILNGCRQVSEDVPASVVSGALASTARIASLDGLPEVQSRVLAALDEHLSHLNQAADGGWWANAREAAPAAELGLAARLAQETGDPDTAIAFDLFADSSKPDRLADLLGVDQDDGYFPMFREYREVGQAGAAALLFDSAIDQAARSRFTIAKMMQDEGTRRAASRRGRAGRSVSSTPSDESAAAAALASGPSSETTLDLVKRESAEPAPAPSAEARMEMTASTAEAVPAEGAAAGSQKRHVNAWFEDGELPLETMRRYSLAVNIGAARGDGLGTKPLAEPDFADNEGIDLLVVVGGQGYSVVQRQQPLRLLRVGESDVARFAITPLDETFLLRISVYLADDLALLEEFEFPLVAQARSRAA